MESQAAELTQENFPGSAPRFRFGGFMKCVPLAGSANSDFRPRSGLCIDYRRFVIDYLLGIGVSSAFICGCFHVVPRNAEGAGTREESYEWRTVRRATHASPLRRDPFPLRLSGPA
jgi:hypothetical protein